MKLVEPLVLAAEPVVAQAVEVVVAVAASGPMSQAARQMRQRVLRRGQTSPRTSIANILKDQERKPIQYIS